MSGLLPASKLENTLKKARRVPPVYDPSNYIPILVVCGYIIFGIFLYALWNRGRTLPAWYVDSARRRREKVLVVLWYTTAVALWPLLMLGLMSVLLGAMCRKVRDRGRRLFRDGGRRRRRDAVDLERWSEVPLNRGSSRAPATVVVFVDPFEDRGRLSSRARADGPEVSEDRSPRDCGANRGSEQRLPPTVWCNRLPSPVEMQRATVQASLGGSSSSSSSSPSSSEGGRSPGSSHPSGSGSGDVNSNGSAAPPASLPRGGDRIIDSNPIGKAEALQWLQTIPEDERGDLGGCLGRTRALAARTPRATTP
ncbi:hypothetical protein LZ32DRAFT_24135 [Colletotrichum eremochloae]|nr:hypothetical protein LZ32DRAFT_24135 [Colletotrichum eremochloae]